MFRAHRAHHQERQIVLTQPLVTFTLCQWPCHVQVGNSLRQRVGTRDLVYGMLGSFIGQGHGRGQGSSEA
jgi:hypothetical protein